MNDKHGSLSIEIIDWTIHAVAPTQKNNVLIKNAHDLDESRGSVTASYPTHMLY